MGERKERAYRVRPFFKLHSRRRGGTTTPPSFLIHFRDGGLGLPPTVVSSWFSRRRGGCPPRRRIWLDFKTARWAYHLAVVSARFRDGEVGLPPRRHICSVSRRRGGPTTSPSFLLCFRDGEVGLYLAVVWLDFKMARWAYHLAVVSARFRDGKVGLPPCRRTCLVSRRRGGPSTSPSFLLCFRDGTSPSYSFHRRQGG
jgi:hypothetical protein